MAGDGARGEAGLPKSLSQQVKSLWSFAKYNTISFGRGPAFYARTPLFRGPLSREILLYSELDLPFPKMCYGPAGLAILQGQTLLQIDSLAHGSGLLRDMFQVKIISERTPEDTGRHGRYGVICFEGCRLGEISWRQSLGRAETETQWFTISLRLAVAAAGGEGKQAHFQSVQLHFQANQWTWEWKVVLPRICVPIHSGCYVVASFWLAHYAPTCILVLCLAKKHWQPYQLLNLQQSIYILSITYIE